MGCAKNECHLSEPDVIIQIAKTNKPWSVVVGLITKKDAQNPDQMKINAYRVLLARGRDATIIYIPNKLTLKST